MTSISRICFFSVPSCCSLRVRILAFSWFVISRRNGFRLGVMIRLTSAVKTATIAGEV